VTESCTWGRTGRPPSATHSSAVPSGRTRGARSLLSVFPSLTPPLAFAAPHGAWCTPAGAAAAAGNNGYRRGDEGWNGEGRGGGTGRHGSGRICAMPPGPRVSKAGHGCMPASGGLTQRPLVRPILAGATGWRTPHVARPECALACDGSVGCRLPGGGWEMCSPQMKASRAHSMRAAELHRGVRELRWQVRCGYGCDMRVRARACVCVCVCTRTCRRARCVWEGVR